MSFRRDRRGFIFSLDATLAILVVLIVMAGVARVAGPELTYEQHGYLRLERYANDALEVMQLSGMMNNILNLIKNDNLLEAGDIARKNLRAILPEEVQFKLVIGERENPRLEVYPGFDNQVWGNRFENAAERAIAARVTSELAEPIKVLVWLENRLPDPQPELIENFIENARKLLWDIRIEDEEDEFRDYLENQKDWYPEVVFLPDAESFAEPTIEALVDFNKKGGGVVGGGGLLWNNRSWWGGWFLWRMFGIQTPFFWPHDPEFGHENMDVIDHTHYVSAASPENIEYAGESYPIYDYDLPFWDPWRTENVLAVWPETAEEWPWWPWWFQEPWIGVIARTKRISEGEWGSRWWWWNWWSWRLGGNTVMINAHLAQSAMGPKVGTEEWITLAQRAIEWTSRKKPEFAQVKLYVWRGERAGG